MLPILIRISKELLKNCDEYIAFSKDASNFLVCQTCHASETEANNGIKKWSKAEYQKQSLLVRKIEENAIKLIEFIMNKEPMMHPQ